MSIIQQFFGPKTTTVYGLSEYDIKARHPDAFSIQCISPFTWSGLIPFKKSTAKSEKRA